VPRRPTAGGRVRSLRASGVEEARVRLVSFHCDLLVLGELEEPREQLGLLRL
jgi:hypothetical protein